jgi:hypothetical protein
MNSKQKVNDKCLCGSSKKYKKCCKNKSVSNIIPTNITNNETIETYTYLPAQSHEQLIYRSMIEEKFKNIKEPHCKICGDTENDGKILKIPTQIGDIYLCQFCYDIQINM